MVFQAAKDCGNFDLWHRIGGKLRLTWSLKCDTFFVCSESLWMVQRSCSVIITAWFWILWCPLRFLRRNIMRVPIIESAKRSQVGSWTSSISRGWQIMLMCWANRSQMMHFMAWLNLCYFECRSLEERRGIRIFWRLTLFVIWKWLCEQGRLFVLWLWLYVLMKVNECGFVCDLRCIWKGSIGAVVHLASKEPGYVGTLICPGDAKLYRWMRLSSIWCQRRQHERCGIVVCGIFWCQNEKTVGSCNSLSSHFTLENVCSV
jgi:hypothetical protein